MLGINIQKALQPSKKEQCHNAQVQSEMAQGQAVFRFYTQRSGNMHPDSFQSLRAPGGSGM